MSKEVEFINIFPMNDRQQNMDYSKVAKEVIDYSVDIGFKYTLMTVGDKRIDPWIISQYCMQQDSRFSPLVAVNPFYQHPVTVVKNIISLKTLYPSKLAINLVTGSFFSEIRAVHDNLDFEERSRRLHEFYESLLALTDPQKSGFNGSYYHALAAEIFPKYTFGPMDFFLSGSLAQELKPSEHSHFVRSIRPIEEMETAPTLTSGLSLGICARGTTEEALSEVDRIYPPDRRGEMLFSISISNKATPWNKWLKSYIENNKAEKNLYFLKPMKNFWSSAPYVVGSYEEVANRLKEYANLGYSFFILDFIPEEACHVKKCLEFYKKL